MGDDVKLFDWFIYHGYTPAPESAYDSVEKLKVDIGQARLLLRAERSIHIRQQCCESACVYEFPAKDVQHVDGETFYINVPVYDSPCILTERAALNLLK